MEQSSDPSPIDPYPSFLTIPSKPHAPISYTFFPHVPSSTLSESNVPLDHTLVVFVNGLGLPASSWESCISVLRSHAKKAPPLLTFDRYGQGLTTARDPLDDGNGYGHDFMDAANDLHEIILVIASTKLGLDKTDVEDGRLSVTFVAASIGVPIARLYVQSHPFICAALIALDSNIANVNYSDFLPDPLSPTFDPSTVLAPDCSLPQYIEARTRLTSVFDLSVPNSESMDRRPGPKLLPYADNPKLIGTDGKGPWLTVVGHDPITFADASLERMGTPKSMSMRFTNPYWAKYNAGLVSITDEDRCEGVKIASGCGHFIQIDDPDFLAEEIKVILEKLDLA
ncbi:putative prolyl aminopeptidase protein [Botrytis fragariae]|uniref:Putative prolyl aminopeptidase protein n=1 Tax=Botrytis fragariae TaxID=1964551 RepID=A0A8H6AZN8_9HELO|nr:putative prolyl aminopeptidase protein [Botrytis fragariae]KAF5876529.1 putative prolyl aminopeptidase protein [Botrytis fragariae]